MTQHGDQIRYEGPKLSRETIEHYFVFSEPMKKIWKSFPSEDPWLREAMEFCPGIRILRGDPWETTAMFICSAMKQVPHIEQMNDHLRRRFGKEVKPGRWTFPTPEVLAKASEADLRACSLGFRAPHLLKTARQIASGEIDLAAISKIPTPLAREQLMQLRGVGEKVANCILLYSFHRLEVVPIDIWMERVFKSLSFAKKRNLKRERLLQLIDKHFGPNAGYAQQYLFHWARKKWKGGKSA